MQAARVPAGKAADTWPANLAAGSSRQGAFLSALACSGALAAFVWRARAAAMSDPIQGSSAPAPASAVGQPVAETAGGPTGTGGPDRQVCAPQLLCSPLPLALVLCKAELEVCQSVQLAVAAMLSCWSSTQLHQHHTRLVDIRVGSQGPWPSSNCDATVCGPMPPANCPSHARSILHHRRSLRCLLSTQTRRQLARQARTYWRRQAQSRSALLLVARSGCLPTFLPNAAACRNYCRTSPP